MTDKTMSQFLPADIFLKSSVIEKNPDMSFRELVAEYFGVSPEDIISIRRSGDAIGWDIDIEGLEDEDDDYQWDLGLEEEEESEWMTPKEMGIAQKMDWSDEEGNEISDREKMRYFMSRDDLYEVDLENGLVRLLPEEDWFPNDEEDLW